MSQITKPWLPLVNQPAINRNPAYWPEQTTSFLSWGYGGEKARKAEEDRRGDDAHAPPAYCYQLAAAWCDKMDLHVADFFLLPKGSFRDSALDRSAKDKTPKGDGQ